MQKPSLMLPTVSTIAEPQNSATTLQTVERALSFLEVVAQASSPPPLRDVADALGLKITTSYHLLNTLRGAGYLIRNADGTLRIGPRAAVLYNGLVRQMAGGEELRPIIEWLSSETLETAYLCGLNESGVVVQMLIEGGHAVRVSGLYIGFSGSEHERATGKAVLAHMSDVDRTGLLARTTAGLTAAQRKKVLAELAKELDVVRQQGYALDEEHFQKGASCVAAPFFKMGGAIAGSIAVSVPCTRFEEAKDTLTAAVVSAAGQASVLLGHRPDEA
jgi:IclR family transcriptional regulator, acetate operon repressor